MSHKDTATRCRNAGTVALPKPERGQLGSVPSSPRRRTRRRFEVQWPGGLRRSRTLVRRTTQYLSPVGRGRPCQLAAVSRLTAAESSWAASKKQRRFQYRRKIDAPQPLRQGAFAVSIIAAGRNRDGRGSRATMLATTSLVCYTRDAMSLVEEANTVRQRIVDRLRELEPVIREYNELRQLAVEMGLEERDFTAAAQSRRLRAPLAPKRILNAKMSASPRGPRRPRTTAQHPRQDGRFCESAFNAGAGAAAGC